MFFIRFIFCIRNQTFLVSLPSNVSYESMTYEKLTHSWCHMYRFKILIRIQTPKTTKKRLETFFHMLSDSKMITRILNNVLVMQ